MNWKLRYAAHLGIRSTDEPMFRHTLDSADPLAQIRHAASLGLAGVFDNLARTRPVEVQEQMAQALRRLGLSMGCISCSTDVQATRNWASDEPGTRALLRSELMDAIATAQRLGGRHLIVSPGRDARVPIGFEMAGLVATLRELAGLAGRADVVLCLEPTNEARVPGRLLHHLADAWRVVQAVGSPHVQLVFDTHHIQAMDGDLIANFRRVKDAVAVVQLADNPGRFEPGTGEINFANFLRVLRDEGYEGLVELEYYTATPGAEGEQLALDALRRIDAAI